MTVDHVDNPNGLVVVRLLDTCPFSTVVCLIRHAESQSETGRLLVDNVDERWYRESPQSASCPSSSCWNHKQSISKEESAIVDWIDCLCSDPSSPAAQFRTLKSTHVRKIREVQKQARGSSFVDCVVSAKPRVKNPHNCLITPQTKPKKSST